MMAAAMIADHPHADPHDGRTQCPTCGKWIWPVTHSCKGIRVVKPPLDADADQTLAELAERQAQPNGLEGVL